MIQSSKIMIVMGLSRVQKKLRIFNPQQNWIFAIKYHHRTRLWSIFGLPGLSGGLRGACGNQIYQFPNGTIIGPEMSFLDLNKF